MATDRRIVLVDDSAKVRAALRWLLERSGFDVVAETADYDDAVDLVVTTKPDAVLLDWMFEGRPRGALALASLRRWAPEVPVVVYTAYPDDAMGDAVSLGAARVVTKDIGRSGELPVVLHTVIAESGDCGPLDPPSHHEAAATRERREVIAGRERARPCLGSLLDKQDE